MKYLILSFTILSFTIVLSTMLFSNGLNAQPQSSSVVRPNIILITADDMGFDDLSLHNNPHTNTQHLDALAKHAVQFSDFTVTPVCSTTRAALLTGRDPYRTGVSGVHGGRDFLKLDETLLSEYLRDQGYATGTWGKWHLGKTAGYLPWDRGFDEAYYAELYQHQQSFGWLNGKKVEHQQWVSDVVTDYAINFIDATIQQTSQSNTTQPFFAYLSYLAPHEPWSAPVEFVAPFIAQGLRPAVANLYGMIDEMDFHIGRLLKHLHQRDLLDNTIIIFLSDNGPWWDSSNMGAMLKNEWEQRNPSKMHGNKGQSWQNGIRSPLFIHWPKQFKAATVDRYVDVKDLLPTLLDILGEDTSIAVNPLDGQSFLPYLHGDVAGENTRETYIASHDVVVNEQGFNQWTPVDDEARGAMNFIDQTIGLRTERYKLLLNPAMDNNTYPLPRRHYVLFDMQEDPLERTNIFDEKSQVSQHMVKSLQHKFFDILEDTHSFAPPVFQLGDHISVVNGFGPSHIEGQVNSRPHHLRGLASVGDSAMYQINVLQNQTYHVFLQQNNTDAAGISIALKINHHATTHMLNGELMQKLTTIKLKQGSGAITLSVLGNASIKPWTSISGLRRIIFVPENSLAEFAAFTHPY